MNVPTTNKKSSQLPRLNTTPQNVQERMLETTYYKSH